MEPANLRCCGCRDRCRDSATRGGALYIDYCRDSARRGGALYIDCCRDSAR
jgi:hypothetical protein